MITYNLKLYMYKLRAIPHLHCVVKIYSSGTAHVCDQIVASLNMSCYILDSTVVYQLWVLVKLGGPMHSRYFSMHAPFIVLGYHAQDLSLLLHSHVLRRSSSSSSE